MMILGQVSWLDIFVFLLFLAPQLIYNVGFFRTLICGIRALPFLLIKLPLSFIRDHFLTRQAQRNPFVQQATWFEDITIRCVRYAFASIPASIGRVFFSKYVSLPFLRFRMLRHGYFRSPIHWQEINMNTFKGLWITEGINPDPDIIIIYAHGGGFSMGSSHFYLEFLIAWLHLLKSSGYRNPAIFALEYTLVPDAAYPTQLYQAISAYKNICVNHDPARIVVAGDSAGATIILSLLLYIAKENEEKERDRDGNANRWKMEKPGMAVLISPWVTLVGKGERNTEADYLDVKSLQLYARQYAGENKVDDPLVSPGNCVDKDWWARASPERGWFFCWGREEVFAGEIRRLVGLLEGLEGEGVTVEKREEKGGIHAWPVAALFLSSTAEERQKGLKMMVSRIRERMGN